MPPVSIAVTSLVCRSRAREEPQVAATVDAAKALLALERSIDEVKRCTMVIGRSPGRAFAYGAAVSSAEAVEAMVAEVVRRLGHIDICVNPGIEERRRAQRGGARAPGPVSAIARCRDAPPSPLGTTWRRFEVALDAVVARARIAA